MIKNQSLNVITNMGISINSHGKKSDKETQSPLLKIFKEIMMRENNDPEKRNLLDQKEERKRKQYNGSKAKLDRRSIDSNSSVHRKRSPYKVVSTEQRNTNVVRENPSGVYQGEKKESWWNWRKPAPQNDSADDTCSCVSCALKRIVSSEYACIGCLVLVFCISVVVACLLVFKNIPMVASDNSVKTGPLHILTGGQATTITDSERLKRKIEMINENRIKNELSEEGVFGKPHYDDIRSDPMDLPGSSEIDFGPNLRELNSLEDGESRSLGDTDFSPLEPEKMEIHSSDKLKEFYTKLVQTDVKIKNLKKLIAENNSNNNAYDGRTPDRAKRSLKLYDPENPIIRRKRQVYPIIHRFKHLPKRKGKLKRFSNASDDSTGFVIEKKKLVVQYKPSVQYESGLNGKKLVAKCSHSPKEAHSHQHEHQLKHPFYQNTQRLDELLDRFLNKNLPEIISDPFGLDFLFKPKKEKCKHPQPTMNIDIIGSTDDITKKKEDKTTTAPTTTLSATTKLDLGPEMKLISYSNNGRAQIPKPKIKGKKLKDKHRKLTTIIRPQSDIMKLLRPESTTVYENNFNEHKAQMISKEKLRVVTSSPSDFEVLLSVSTIMNPKIKKAVKVTSYLYDQPPNIRHLMQMDGEEEENLGYEDFKEVLTDEMDSQDEVDKRGDRKKRNKKEFDDYATFESSSGYTTVGPDIPEKIVKYNPPGVQNPNWKGPMPLYPDEINSMIKHAAMHANKIFGSGSASDDKDVLTAASNRQRRDLSDVEYVEDYLDNKYDKLVEMAQAYSDYGVLEGKKDTVRNEKNPATDNISVDHRVKLSADGALKRRVVTRENKEQYGTITIMPTSSEMTQATTESEGIRLELIPTTESRLEDINVYKFFNSHFKINSGEITNNTERPTAVNSLQISLSANCNEPYTSRVDFKSMYTKKKEESINEQIDDMSRHFADCKGKTLLATFIKEPDNKINQTKLDKTNTDDFDFVHNNKIKRDTIPKNQRFNAKYYAGAIKQLRNTIQYRKAEHTTSCDNAATIAAKELDKYNMAHATKANVDIFKYPYLIPSKSKPSPPPKSAPVKSMMSNTNITSGMKGTTIIILGPQTLRTTTVKSTPQIKNQKISEPEQSSNGNDESGQILYDPEQNPMELEPDPNHTSEMKQNPSERSELDQSQRKPSELKQIQNKLSYTQQSQSKPFELDQSPSKPSELDQSPGTPSELDQSQSKPFELDQSKPSELEQVQNKLSESEQSQSIPSQIEESPNLSDLEPIPNNPSEMELNPNKPSQLDQVSKTSVLKQKPSKVSELELQRNKTAEKNINREVERILSELQGNTNTDEKFNETSVTIHSFEMRPKNILGSTYEGQIVLKLKNPTFGDENIELSFDSTFCLTDSTSESSQEFNHKDSKEEFLHISFQNNPNITATPTLPASLTAKVTGRRGKREVDELEKILESIEKSNVTKPQEAPQNKDTKEKVLLGNETRPILDIKQLFNVSINSGTKENVTPKVNHSKDNITLSEFFMMISNWFKTLEGLKERKDKVKDDPIDEITDLLQQFNKEPNSTNSKQVSSSESAYPLYDSDMIENIGHRSRVLLSIRDSNATEDEVTNTTEDVTVREEKSVNVSVNDANTTVANASTTPLTANITTLEQDTHTTTNAPKKDGDTRKVKRNADDSNLIFWNDIYDDEYGIQTDNLDSVIRADKIYTKGNDFVKRSGRWVQDKIRKFAENLKGREQVESVKGRLPRAAKRIGDYPRYITNKVYGTFKKRSPNDQEDEESDQMSVFNTLGANMVEVCKKAAMAVKQTSNTEVKEDTMQSNVATSLMQQLVRLLTDLVDYQVQARTCTKLPPDLKSFLEWLTYPDEELERSGTERNPETETVASSFKTTLPYPEEDVLDELVKADTHSAEYGTTMLPIEGLQEKGDYKTQYLETLRSVQDLIDQYEEMSDEDKSKMTGVKFYLQNQLRFLNKQFTGYDMYNFFDKHGLPLLYKRELPLKGPNQRHKRKLYKFIRNFGKKHTKTTASYYDGLLVTEMKKAKVVFDSRMEDLKRQDKLKQNDPKNVKRNLKDVYYKAIAEAKKYATAKSGHKKQDNVEVSSTLSTRAHDAGPL